MNLLVIAQKLQTLEFGSLGTNLFYEHMPVTVKRGLLVTAQTPITRDKYVARLRSGSFQVIARQLDDEDYQDPEVILNGVIDAIAGENVIIGDMRFLYLRARHDPLVFPKSDGNVVEASVNFDILFTV